MSGATIRSAFPPGRRAERRAKAREQQPAATSPPGPSRAARMLALAHYIEGLIEAGRLSGYAAAARELGLTRARLTQVMGLLVLAPEIQEAVSVGKLRASERVLRRTVREPEWELQRQTLVEHARP